MACCVVKVDGVREKAMCEVEGVSQPAIPPADTEDHQDASGGAEQRGHTGRCGKTYRETTKVGILTGSAWKQLCGELSEAASDGGKRKSSAGGMKSGWWEKAKEGLNKPRLKSRLEEIEGD